MKKAPLMKARLKSNETKIWCLGRESNPHTPEDTGFSYQLRFSPPAKIAVCGLDFTFTFYYFHSSQAGTVKSLHFFEFYET